MQRRKRGRQTVVKLIVHLLLDILDILYNWFKHLQTEVNRSTTRAYHKKNVVKRENQIKRKKKLGFLVSLSETEIRK